MEFLCKMYPTHNPDVILMAILTRNLLKSLLICFLDGPHPSMVIYI